MTSISAGHIILTPTQPVGSGRPQRGSNPEPPHQESRALPQSYRIPPPPPRVAVEWKPEGHRKRGRLRMTWRRTVEAEVTAMGHSWGTLRTLAQDRLRWREFVAPLVVYDKKGSK